MFNVSDLGELLPDVFSTLGHDWGWPSVLVIILVCLVITLIRSFKGTFKNIAQILIILILFPLLILIFVFNFILRCMRIDLLPLDFLKDLLPWSNKMSTEAEDAPKEKQTRPCSKGCCFI